MAPIKFEEHVKEQLDKRNIQPSGGSWEKLNARLDNSEGKAGIKWWIPAIAAMLVLLLGSLLFIKLQQNETPLVETPVEEQPEIRNKENEFNQPVQVASEEKMEKKAEIIESKAPVKTNRNSVPPKSQEENNTAGKLVQNQVQERFSIIPVKIEPPVIREESTARFSEKIEEVIAKVSQKESENGDISEAEVNALLAQAAREISQSRDYSTGSISAEALLADVEYEMDESFRQEVFEVLKEGFLKARTAIATRND